MIKAPQAREERPHNEAWNGGALMVRSRRIPGRLEAGVSLKAFGETEVREMLGKREEETWSRSLLRTLLSKIRLQDDKGSYDELRFRLISPGSDPASFRLGPTR